VNKDVYKDVYESTSTFVNNCTCVYECTHKCNCRIVAIVHTSATSYMV